MRKKFNLAELITVVAILAILLSLVSVNVGDLRGRAVKAAIVGNVRNLQVASDHFANQNNGLFPSAEQPTPFVPRKLDLPLLEGEYIRNLPSVRGVIYWVDFWGKIWGSTIEAPEGHVFNEGVFSWNPVDGAKEYIVYDVSGDGERQWSVEEVYRGVEVSYTGDSSRTYIVSAVDGNGLKTASTGIGYIGGGTEEPPLGSGIEDWGVVSVGWAHTLAIRNGELWAWGQNDGFRSLWDPSRQLGGQLGLGHTVDENRPVRIGTHSDWTHIAAGSRESVSFAIRRGHLYAWGQNDRGQLGLSDRVDRRRPTRVGTDGGWENVVTGLNHAVAIRNGELWGWGESVAGGAYMDTPTRLSPLSGWTHIAAGAQSTFAIRNGELWSAGSNWGGALGLGASAGNGPFPLERRGVLTGWTDVSATTLYSALAIRNGELWSWGYNDSGELGFGDRVVRHDPTRVGERNDWVRVSAGSDHVLAVASGELWAWGANWSGQLGLSDRNDRLSPVRVGELSDWGRISSGIRTSIAIRNRTFFTVGTNRDGQLGLGEESGRLEFTELPFTPQNRPPLAHLAEVSGYIFPGDTLVFDSSGSFDRDDHALTEQWQLNNGPVTTLPPAIAPEAGTHTVRLRVRDSTGMLSDWVERTFLVNIRGWDLAVSGWSHTLALRGGELWAWGDNWAGQLGLGDDVPRLLPARVGEFSDWTDLAVGGAHSLAIRNGELWGWGNTSSGELGLGLPTGQFLSISTPTRIGSHSDWTHVAAGANHTLAIRGGQLWGWGDGAFGVLGLASHLPGWSNIEISPVRIGARSDWTDMSVRGFTNLGIAGGELWSWGWGETRQLGFEDNEIRRLPTRVGSLSGWDKTSIGDFNGFAIRDGELWGWGKNVFGGTGLGHTEETSGPLRIESRFNWTDVSAGHATIFGISNGELFVWGLVSGFDLGFGDAFQLETPTRLGNREGWTNISAGGSGAFLGIRNGELWALGGNQSGQLGLGDTVMRTSPTPVNLP